MGKHLNLLKLEMQLAKSAKEVSKVSKAISSGTLDALDTHFAAPSALLKMHTCQECRHMTHLNSCRENGRNGFIAWIDSRYPDISHRCERFKGYSCQ